MLPLERTRDQRVQADRQTRRAQAFFWNPCIGNSLLQRALANKQVAATGLLFKSFLVADQPSLSDVRCCLDTQNLSKV